MIKARIDASQTVRAYQRAFSQLGRLPGFNQKAVLLGEAGVILKTWAGRTKVATDYQAEMRARYRATKRAFGYTNISQNPYSITVNRGSRGGAAGKVWFRTRNKKFQEAGEVTADGRYLKPWTHFRGEDWAKIQTGAEKYAGWYHVMLAQGQASVGLARQSVIQIADQLGIDLLTVRGGGSLSAAGINKARASIASNGRAYTNGVGGSGGDEVRYYVNMFSRLPYAGKIGMDRTLAGVLSGRTKYIQRSYEKGAFESMDKVKKAFPNVFRYVQ